MTDAWFAFKAYNSQTIYGYGSADDAEKYADHINRGKEINLYAPYEVSDEEAKELDLGNNTEAFNLSDVEIED